MIKNINNPYGLHKMIFPALGSIIILLCTFSMLYSAENKGKDTDGKENNIINLYDREMGRVDEEGIVYNQYGRRLGNVDGDGVIYNVSDIKIGNVKPDGTVVNQSGTRLGSVNGQGDILNVSGRKVGSVKNISNLKLMGGAARLIFLK